MIHEANSTFINSLHVWTEIYEHFPVIQDAAVQLHIAARKGEPYESFDEFKLNFHRTVRTGEFLNLEGEFEKKNTIQWNLDLTNLYLTKSSI